MVTMVKYNTCTLKGRGLAALSEVHIIYLFLRRGLQNVLLEKIMDTVNCLPKI